MPNSKNLLGLSPENPFWRPLWVRLFVIVIVFGWAVLEIASDAYLWGAVAIGTGLYAAWELLWRYDKHYRADADEKDPPEK
jgi:hypothetical protein